MHTRIISVLLITLLPLVGAVLSPNAYSATLPLSGEEEADLLYMREEEKLARDTYLTLYELWDLAIFSNIASSEQMHMNALLKLLNKYKLTDPAADTEIGEFSNDALQSLYNTLIAKGTLSGLDALQVGGIIEETDMRDIKEAIEDSQKEDIDKVYESLICGSRNHLRGFAQSIEALTGQAYVAQVLLQTEVDEILQTPLEKCGKADTTATNTCKGKCLGWMK